MVVKEKDRPSRTYPDLLFLAEYSCKFIKTYGIPVAFYIQIYVHYNSFRNLRKIIEIIIIIICMTYIKDF